ncbi:MAG: zinc ribbon domain-containing protein [Acidobacteriia bacterium]|nr:zinc ribbon domain-containing protein [Terriglobia bacterium]
MALCTSCGNQVEDAASFCTSCGKPMPVAARPSSAVTVARPICASCGAQADPDSVFCTECGKPLNAEPALIGEAAPAVAAIAPPEAKNTAPTASRNPFCTSCGTKLEPGTGFCTNCGQPIADESTNVPHQEKNAAIPTPAVEATQPVRVEPVIANPASDEQTKYPNKAEPVVAAPVASRVESTQSAVAAKPLVEARPIAAVPIQPTLVEPAPVEPTPHVAAPLYATPSDYPPAQPGGNGFRIIVLVLLLLIVIGGFGGWYFMGVETVIVCSPPDVTVFLDGKELPPTSYGRYVIPHLSRQAHLLRVESPGFADTIERLDFPMTSLHEWVNIKLVPRRAIRPSSSR